MPPTSVSRPNGSGDYLFMHFHDAVQMHVAGLMQDCAADTFVVWEPGAPQIFGNKRGRWTHSWIHCGGAAIAESLAASGIEPGQPVALRDGSLAQRYLPAICGEIQSQSIPDPFILDHLFSMWLREVDRAHRYAHRAGATPQNLLRVRRYIESHLSTHIMLDDLAAQANLSCSRLSALFKRYFRTSPIDYVLRLRLRRASYLLLDQNRTVSQVSSEVGFCDAFYFSRQFRSHYGMSPSAYRKQSQIPPGSRYRAQLLSRAPA